MLIGVKPRTGARPHAAAMTRFPRLPMPNLLLPTLLLLVATLVANAATPPQDPPPAIDGLRPGQYEWNPQPAPTGPLVVFISLSDQRAYVYRDGIRIGLSTVSTGKPGHRTPPGVYTILQKRREHYSNLYDAAPMPFMQRLSWDGLALHAGSLPGHPASHGCVRLPRDFAEILFGQTQVGTVVVIAEGGTPPSPGGAPGVLAPAPRDVPGPAASGFEWSPERAPEGPLTVVLSLADSAVVVRRNAVEIGRAEVMLDDPPATGTRAYVVLEAEGSDPAAEAQVRAAPRWLSVYASPTAAPDAAIREAVDAGRIAVAPGFKALVRSELRPGSTLVITDGPLDSPTLPPGEVLTSDPPATEDL